MAGGYPDALGARLPYDRDGSVGIIYNSGAGTITEMTGAQLTGINDESSAGSQVSISGGSTQYWVGFIFPVPMDLTGYFILWRGNKGAWTDGPIQTSNDTTNFMDGTWTQIAASHTTTSPVSPGYRNAQTAISATGVKAVRFRYTSGGAAIGYGWAAVNLYGKITNPIDKLEFWHPTLDQPLADTPGHLDYGDVIRASGAVTKDFRIKNTATTLGATSITIGVEAPTDATPTYVSQTAFSYNGGAFGPSTSIPSLAAGEVSQTITARITTDGTSALGPWTQRYYAVAGAWS